MTAPFSTSLRTRPGTIRLGGAGASAITVRVQLAHAWDAVRIESPSTESVAALKRAALEALAPGSDHHDEYVAKLRGFEVLDESAPLHEVGAVDGSIFLLVSRRRRPVR